MAISEQSKRRNSTDAGLLSQTLALGDGSCFSSEFLWQTEQSFISVAVLPLSLSGPSTDASYEIKQHNNLYREEGALVSIGTLLIYCLYRPYWALGKPIS
jgi:hypothetical protein